MTLNFRHYSKADRSDCLRIFRSNIPRFFRDFEQSGFEEFIDAARHPYFVVESSGEIVGCGGYGVREGSATADLCWGMVAAAFQKKHLGEYLLAGRLNQIVGLPNIGGVHLSTSQYTDGFYQNYGFAVLERKPDDIAAGLDTVVMHLDLTDQQRHRIRELWLKVST